MRRIVWAKYGKPFLIRGRRTTGAPTNPGSTDFSGKRKPAEFQRVKDWRRGRAMRLSCILFAALAVAGGIFQ